MSTENDKKDDGLKPDNEKIQLKNPNIKDTGNDLLYHFALGSKTHDLPAMFGDVRFVVVGGSARRMEGFAEYLKEELKPYMNKEEKLDNLAKDTDRFVLYKVGPVLVSNHGMGFGSISLMMHEVIKILYHARASSDVVFFRIGTSGGLGVEPGTVVVTEQALDPSMQPHLTVNRLGREVIRPALVDQGLVDELITCSQADDNFATIKGKTMCTDDFYEGQGRLDGAFCDYTEEDKMAFLRNAFDHGVRNIEMESLVFSAMCHRAGIRGAVACATFLDRLKGDQVPYPHHVLAEWQDQPGKLVTRFIKKKLKDTM